MSLGINIDMDDTLVDFKSAYDEAREQNPEQPYPQSQYGFFANLEPLPLATLAVEYFVARGHSVYFLSAPSVYNPMSYTEKRVSIEKILGFDWCDKLILACDKAKVRGDILIDDRADSNNQRGFKGKLVLFGSPEFRDWFRVITWFEREYHADATDALHNVVTTHGERRAMVGDLRFIDAARLEMEFHQDVYNAIRGIAHQKLAGDAS